jgi:hypothetical protein
LSAADPLAVDKIRIEHVGDGDGWACRYRCPLSDLGDELLQLLFGFSATPMFSIGHLDDLGFPPPIVFGGHPNT